MTSLSGNPEKDLKVGLQRDQANVRKFMESEVKFIEILGTVCVIENSEFWFCLPLPENFFYASIILTCE